MLLGVSADELVRRHAAAEWTVAFTGFAPGFGYLVSPDWPFEVPRLPSPRTRVPRGAVGLAGEFTGAYPRETPGGWRLIGTTAASLFDADATPPALLAPGTRVRFRPAARAVAPQTRAQRVESRTPGDLAPAPGLTDPRARAARDRRRTSGGPGSQRSGSRRRGRSTAARRARRTDWWATPKALR